MADPRRLFLLAALLGAVAVWLALPRSSRRARGAGMILGVVSLGIFAALLPGLGQWVYQSLFWILAGVTVVSAAAAVTLRSPLYSAIWFGSSLLGTAGLFLFQGAQFLAVATVVVYAGAILVTFLFVLMLAQPEGKASYDRISWEAAISAAMGMIVICVLSIGIGAALSPGKGEGGGSRPDVLHPPSEQEMEANILAPQHVAQFGTEVFSRHLIAVEIAGVLLLVALVGAAVIVERRPRFEEKEPPPEDSRQ
jgi:NADH-quinone oxidoreductase subunit J